MGDRTCPQGSRGRPEREGPSWVAGPSAGGVRTGRRDAGLGMVNGVSEGSPNPGASDPGGPGHAELMRHARSAQGRALGTRKVTKGLRALPTPCAFFQPIPITLWN